MPFEDGREGEISDGDGEGEDGREEWAEEVREGERGVAGEG